MSGNGCQVNDVMRDSVVVIGDVMRDKIIIIGDVVPASPMRN